MGYDTESQNPRVIFPSCVARNFSSDTYTRVEGAGAGYKR